MTVAINRLLAMQKIALASAGEHGGEGSETKTSDYLHGPHVDSK